MKDFYNFFESVFLDIEFSENLTLPVKHQARSLHWSYSQRLSPVISKINGEKVYHAYSSHDCKHEKTFVKIVLDMLQSRLTRKTGLWLLKVITANPNTSPLNMSLTIK